MKHTILICDDDRDIVSALDIYLTSEGYQTVKAYDGKEALAGEVYIKRGDNVPVVVADQNRVFHSSPSQSLHLE